MRTKRSLRTALTMQTLRAASTLYATQARRATRTLLSIVPQLAFLLSAQLFLQSCGSPADNPGMNMGMPDPPCSCATGERRCQGSSAQICEMESASCSSWGPATACPSGMCKSGVCAGSCQDSCPAGTARCAGDTGSEVCRIGSSGCLEWIGQSCTAQQYCDAAQNHCVASVPCDGACPATYICKPNGVCAGGSPTMANLDVKTVKFAGKITLNGALPGFAMGCTTYSSLDSALVTLTDVTHNYSFAIDVPCSATDFAFATAVYPGTYRVTVEGYTYGGYKFSNLPVQPFVIDPALVVTADVAGKVLNVKTVQLAGKVTLNGATPTKGMGCTVYSSLDTATVTLTDAANRYSFSIDAPCSSADFSFAAPIYPGTYRVTVEGYTYGGYKFSNLPVQPFIIDPAFVVAADVTGKVLNVTTVQFAGKVTLNGALPTFDTGCSTYSSLDSAVITLTDATKNYSFSIDTLCKSADFSFSAPIYPGTYRVTVEGYTYGGYKFSNLPVQPFVIDPALVVSADVAGKVLNVKTVKFAGKVTMNGALPTFGPGCTTYSSLDSTVVTLTDATNHYSFAIGTLCKSADFSFTDVIYPGTYRVTVEGYTYGGYKFSNVPVQPFVVDPALVVSADVAGKSLNVKTVKFAGNVTLNGVLPTFSQGCTTYSSLDSALVTLTDATNNYSFALDTLCKSTDFSFADVIYPGTYRVTVEGYTYGGYKFSDLPVQPFVITPALVVSADVAGKVLDVKTLQFAGKITLNGATPLKGMGCTTYSSLDTATVTLVDAANNYNFAIDTPCSSADFSFSSAVYPGTYRVTVQGYTYGGYKFSNLPLQPYVVTSRLQLP